jgi:hypothetical protein
MSIAYELFANNYDPDPEKTSNPQILDMKYLENYLLTSSPPAKDKKNILHMEDIYNQLSPYFEKSWKATYEQLFSKKPNLKEEEIEDL